MESLGKPGRLLLSRGVRKLSPAQRLFPVRVKTLSCPFSSIPNAKFHPVLFFPVDFADAGMRGGGRALSDG
jgi:hypothetical protein